MRAKLWISALLLLLILPVARADTLHIAAAANLQKIFQEALLPAFERKTGQGVVATYGSTKLLAAQLENGAPVDVFVAADTPTVDRLAAHGLIAPSTERAYAVGRLVLWTRRDARLHPHRLQDLANPAYRKIAIANPALAPYGLAAQQAFAKTGLAQTVAPRIVQSENIAQALQYARSGNADVALTALSLVVDDKADPYIIVPDALHAPITQSLGLVRASRKPALGRRFIAFLIGQEAQPVWKRYGYERPRR